jgi:hypothetical protein
MEVVLQRFRGELTMLDRGKGGDVGDSSRGATARALQGQPKRGSSIPDDLNDDIPF